MSPAASAMVRPVARMGFGTRLALAALSGLLGVVAGPPLDLWPLAFLAWAPLLVALHRASPRRALLLGGAHHLTCYLLGFGWLPAVIRTFGELPWVGCWLISLGLFALGAGRGALMAWLATRAAYRGWPRGLTVVLSIAACEALYPLLFPWYAALQIHSVPVLMQLAELGGPALVGVPMAMSGVMVAELAWARIDGRPILRARVAVAALGPFGMGLFGLWRTAAVDARMTAAPTMTVALVQANAPHEGWTLEESIAKYREATQRIEATRQVDLVVWPETALNATIPDSLLERRLQSIAMSPTGAKYISAPLLTGAALSRGEAHTNSAALYANGRVLGVYDKMHPLAMGEYIPFEGVFPWLRRLIPNAGSLTSGTSEDPLVLGDHRISALICYEDILASSTNHAVAHANPDLLVNLTNDAWFGDSTAALAHYALAKFRAVEHRRYLIHATNSGISAFVDPAGRVSGQTRMMEAATSIATVRTMRPYTVYERIGDIPFWMAGFFALFAAHVRRTRVLRFISASPRSLRQDAG